MTAAQRVIKSLAIALAAVLCVSLFGGAFTLAYWLDQTDNDTDPAPAMVRTWAPADPLHRLEVELTTIQLTVQTGDAPAVQTNSERLTLEERDGTVTVRETGRPRPMTDAAEVVTVTLPSTLVLEEAVLSTGAGRVRLQGLQTDRLELELGAGTADLVAVTALSGAFIDGGAGRLTVQEGQLANLELDMGAGQLLLQTALSGTADIDLGVGAAQVTLPDPADAYTFCVDKGVGRMTLNGRALSDGETIGHGATVVQIDGDVGHVTLLTADGT